MVPKTFCKTENIVLSYDGSSSSVHAIKQFAQLFPYLCDLDTLLVYMHSDKNPSLPDMDLVEELVSSHFSKLTLFKANIKAKQHLAPWMENQTKTLLVTGAYGRNYLSRIFHASFIEQVVKANDLPIFVAHR